jgi:SMC interacting uncharacterized protein involved in chromosome segregation
MKNKMKSYQRYKTKVERLRSSLWEKDEEIASLKEKIVEADDAKRRAKILQRMTQQR